MLQSKVGLRNVATDDLEFWSSRNSPRCCFVRPVSVCTSVHYDI